MMVVLRLLCFLALFMSLTTDSWSKPPTPTGWKHSQGQQPEPEQSKQAPSGDETTAKQTPPLVEDHPSPDAEGKTAGHSGKVEEETSQNWRTPEGVIAIFTIVLAVVAALQLGVFGWQGWQLKNTVIAMREGATTQSTDMQASITAAKTAAQAGIDANKLTGEMLTAEQRPWVKFAAIELVSGLTYDINGASITIRFTLKNIGRTPAADTWVNVFFYSIGPHSKSPREEQLRLISEAKARPASGNIGSILFPGDPLIEEITMTIGKDEIEKINSQETHKFLIPTVIACIQYRFIFTRENHVTTEILSILKKPHVAFRADFTPVKLDALLLQRSFMGSGYAD